MTEKTDGVKTGAEGDRQIIERLMRQVERLEQDNRMLATMNETAQRLREKDADEKRTQYRYADWMLESCPAMILVFDEELRLVLGSAAAAPLLKGEPSRLSGAPFYRVLNDKLEESWRDKLYLQSRRVLTEGKPYRSQELIRLSGKRKLHLQMTISPIGGRTGKARGIVLTAEDVTALAVERERAVEAVRSKSLFLSNMSHEIRTPMNAVKGLSELLALTELNDIQHNYINNIIASANSLLGIINDVLDYSGIDAKKIEIVNEPYNSAEMIAGVCNVINMREDNKSVKLIIDASPELPSVLSGDEIRIKQIMTNLLSNALKYTSEGYVRMRVAMEHDGEGYWLVCAVEDSGIGIRREELPTLFDAFTRDEPQTGRRGPGLGLAICRQLVLLMGGEIKVTSNYGKGSRFTFRVPQQVVDSRPIARVEDPGKKCVALLMQPEGCEGAGSLLDSLGVRYVQVSDSEAFLAADLNKCTHCIVQDSFSQLEIDIARRKLPGCPFAVTRDIRQSPGAPDSGDTVLFLPLLSTDLARFLNGRTDREGSYQPEGMESVPGDFTLRDTRILAVDDNEINLVVSGEMLRAFKAEVLCADSGAEALRLCEEQKFDLIFMDHIMPEMDGIETTREIRMTKSFNQYTPIIALTANVTEDIKSFYIRSGMDDFIAKPIEFSQLGRSLYRWLPKDKIVENPRQEEPADRSEPGAGPDLLAVLEEFGLHVGAAGLGRPDYIELLHRTGPALEEALDRLREGDCVNRKQELSDLLSQLSRTLSGIRADRWAEEADALAREVAKSGLDSHAAQYHGLLESVRMLWGKLEVIASALGGGEAKELPPDNRRYLHDCLKELGEALHSRDYGEAMTWLQVIMAHSLNRRLDKRLGNILEALEELDYDQALLHQAAAREMTGKPER